MEDDRLVLTPLSNAKEISKVLANDTARAILEKVTEEHLSASQLSGKLDKPLTTIDYNLKNLKEANLIKVVRRAKTEKNRIVDLWGPEKKFVVITPNLKKKKALETLKKVIPLIGVSAAIGAIIEWFSYRPSSFSSEMAVKSSMSQGAVGKGIETTAGAVSPHYGIIFFLVCLVIILVYLYWSEWKLPDIS